MAKKRKEKKDEEELDFKLPKFDEEKFLKKERRNIKTLFLSFLLGFIIALISLGFWALLSESGLRWELVLLFGVFNASWLKYLFMRLNIDLTDFGRKGWFGSYAIYFFTWLIVLIILVNPPFYDDESPYVDVVVLPDVQELGGTVRIAAQIIDNVGVEKQDISFTLTDPDGSPISADFTFANNIFSYTHESPDNLTGNNTYTFKLTAKDVNGRITEKEGTFKYDNDVIILTTPENGSNLYSYTPIELKVNSNIYTPTEFKIGDNAYTKDFRVYYKIDDGEEINVSRLDEDNRDDYRTSAEYAGWQKSKNVSLNAYVEVIYYFKGVNIKFSNTIRDTTTYYFKTLDDVKIGESDPLIPPNPLYKLNSEKQPENIFNYYLPKYEPIGATPGFEVAIFLISLVFVALLFKYRKKDKKK